MEIFYYIYRVYYLSSLFSLPDVFSFSRVQPTSLPPSDRARRRKESRWEETLISFNTMMMCSPLFFFLVVPDSLPSRFHPWLFVFIIYPVRLRRVFPRFIYMCFLHFLPSFIFVFMNYSTCRSMFRPLCYIYLSNPPSRLFSEFFLFFCLSCRSILPSLGLLLLKLANLFRLLYDCLLADEEHKRKMDKTILFFIIIKNIQLELYFNFFVFVLPFSPT